MNLDVRQPTDVVHIRESWMKLNRTVLHVLMPTRRRRRHVVNNLFCLMRRGLIALSWRAGLPARHGSCACACWETRCCDPLQLFPVILLMHFPPRGQREVRGETRFSSLPPPAALGSVLVAPSPSSQPRLSSLGLNSL